MRKQLPPCDHVPRPYTGPSREEILEMRRQFTNPAIFTLYGEPLLIVEGHMQYLFDETGRRYLDFFAGIGWDLRCQPVCLDGLLLLCGGQRPRDRVLYGLPWRVRDLGNARHVNHRVAYLYGDGDQQRAGHRQQR